MRETENNKRYKAAMQGVRMQNVKMQQEAADKGSLQVNVTSSVNVECNCGSVSCDT